MAANLHDIFMLFGDSITQGAWEPGLNGFGQRLSHVYARKLDVLNHGYSGYNTEWGLPVFEQCIAKTDEKHAPKIRVLVIWFGANDSCIKPSPQHIPLAKFVSNLKQMIDMIKSPESPRFSPETRIILISPPPVNTIVRKADLESREPPMELDRLFDVTRNYAEAVRILARDEGVGFVDIWTALWDAAGKEENGLAKVLGDGLHLNEAGYAILYDELIKTIGKDYPEVHYDNIGYVFPPWKDIDWENPAASMYINKRA
ncbi:SGNH hydrolase-type esterase domain-containing protein [Gymnopilus junonius]|uniref:SGNH hydrolase-type esterase domain-containing protein n=1 Tax=Gymnopilus junonius TaxID=109634 RepID=A0A9P5TTH9_GYMJU|nr:SGNH hydrolase-type esterase domain-containing protein [Gymnopilus junonius]